jgi:short subunit dehydrogenase-like uncharacterized protein
VNERELDVVVFGASGFVGRLVAAYLARAAPASLRIGLAGRSRERLAAVRAKLGTTAAGWPLLVADLDEPETLPAVAAATHVVATTAGPYAPAGLALVEACVQERTDYCDLAGELLFIRESIERHHAGAAADGVRIVHACGVDSIPSDLGVLLLAEAARTAGASGLEETLALVTAFRGGFSGGTLATMRGELRAVRTDPRARRIVADPYALSPNRDDEPELGPQPLLQRLTRDDTHCMWLAPFVMATINTRIVRRSNALQNWAYGRNLRYRETRAYPTGAAGALRAGANTLGLQLLAAAMASPRMQAPLGRILPTPGEGPSEERRRRGAFAIEMHTVTDDGRRHRAQIAGNGDPGYTLSSLMLAQSALCLTIDRDRLPPRAGVLTPATGMGHALVERLRAAGMTLQAD